MEFHEVVPQCRVNLDWGKCFDCGVMERQGVMNIPMAASAAEVFMIKCNRSANRGAKRSAA